MDGIKNYYDCKDEKNIPEVSLLFIKKGNQTFFLYERPVVK